MLLAIALVPFYVRYLGVESYGLVGLLAAFQGMANLLDLGIGATLNREMARLSATEGNEPGQRNLLRTLEIIYWGLAAVIATVAMLLAPVLASKWVNPLTLSARVITDSFRLMGLCVALQFLFGFYQGGLMGLQRQVLVNWILVLVSTVRAVGAVLVLIFVSRRIEVFFLWQIVPVAVGGLLTRRYLWQAIQHCSQPKFSLPAWKSTWKFASGWAICSMLYVIFAQTDMIILSKLLTLDCIGYYALAKTMVQPLTTMAGAVAASALPRFNQLVELRNTGELSAIYHKSTQFLISLLVPTSVILVLFSRDILLLWTRDVAIADNAHLILSYLVVGALFSGILWIPGYLQSAFGFFRLLIVTLIALNILYVPLLVCLVHIDKADGAALSYAVANFCFFLYVPLMHRHFLKEEFVTWLLRDITMPAVVAVLCGLAVKALLPESTDGVGKLVVVTVAYGAVAFSAVCTLSRIRPVLQTRVLIGKLRKAEFP
ncbi:MAG: oligosaccharide flippase family protein [Desulfomonilaceae bacterium]